MGFRRKLSLAAACGTIVIAFAILEGCLYIPVHVTTAGHDVGGKFGFQPGKHAFTVGLATREQIMQVIGDPNYATPDLSEICYTWNKLNGFWFAPLCFEVINRSGARAIVLHFNRRGVLDDFQLLRANQDPSFPFFEIDENRYFRNPTVPLDRRFRSFRDLMSTTLPTVGPAN